MSGDGTIGGGGSLLMKFHAEDKHGKHSWAAFDEAACCAGAKGGGQPSTITVAFPKDLEKEPITVELREGPCVTIHWT